LQPMDGQYLQDEVGYGVHKHNVYKEAENEIVQVEDEDLATPCFPPGTPDLNHPGWAWDGRTPKPGLRPIAGLTWADRNIRYSWYPDEESNQPPIKFQPENTSADLSNVQNGNVVWDGHGKLRPAAGYRWRLADPVVANDYSTVPFDSVDKIVSFIQNKFSGGDTKAAHQLQAAVYYGNLAAMLNGESAKWVSSQVFDIPNNSLIPIELQSLKFHAAKVVNDPIVPEPFRPDPSISKAVENRERYKDRWNQAHAELMTLSPTKPEQRPRVAELQIIEDEADEEIRAYNSSVRDQVAQLVPTLAPKKEAEKKYRLVE